MQYRSRCCHSDNWGKKTMSVVLGIKGFKTHFTTENGELLSHVFRESSRKCISDTWMPRKKTPHRERFAKEMATRKGKQNRTQIIGVSATAHMVLYDVRFNGDYIYIYTYTASPA